MNRKDTACLAAWQGLVEQQIKELKKRVVELETKSKSLQQVQNDVNCTDNQGNRGNQ